MLINFKKEGLFGEKIGVSTHLENKTSMHSITALNDGRELAGSDLPGDEVNDAEN